MYAYAVEKKTEFNSIRTLLDYFQIRLFNANSYSAISSTYAHPLLSLRLVIQGCRHCCLYRKGLVRRHSVLNGLKETEAGATDRFVLD